MRSVSISFCVTIFQHCKPWWTLHPFNNACHSCQGGKAVPTYRHQRSAGMKRREVMLIVGAARSRNWRDACCTRRWHSCSCPVQCIKGKMSILRLQNQCEEIIYRQHCVSVSGSQAEARLLFGVCHVAAGYMLG